MSEMYEYKGEEIYTSVAGSFARFTIEKRVPFILEELIKGNSFPKDVENKLWELRKSVPQGQLTPLGRNYPFAPEINKTLEYNSTYGWLNAPFLFVENYLYHKVAEICRFFENRQDYFLYKKSADMDKGMDRFSEKLGQINSIDSFPEICFMNLLGNKADLSQNSSYYSSDSAMDLLIDHRLSISSAISGASQVDIVLDNSGEELFFDLLFVYWLLSKTTVSEIRLHFKMIPYFVSDALISDYRLLLDKLGENRNTAWFAKELNRFEDKGKIVLEEDPFWSSGKSFCRIPENLYGRLSSTDLIIFKGDLNYRRLVGDFYWPFEYKTSTLINFLPSPILISRILKSEVMVGLATDEVPDKENRDWMFSGRFGQLELVESPR